jgi:hypothetical protein
VGETGIINIINFTDPFAPALLGSFTIPSTGTDIEVCSGIVAIAMEGADNKQQLGKVRVTAISSQYHLPVNHYLPI